MQGSEKQRGKARKRERDYIREKEAVRGMFTSINALSPAGVQSF